MKSILIYILSLLFYCFLDVKADAINLRYRMGGELITDPLKIFGKNFAFSSLLVRYK
jgi:hypothetical protein